MLLFCNANAVQVARCCVEQGRLIDGLRECYAELAHCLYMSSSSLSHLTNAVAAAAVSAATTEGELRSQEDNLKKQISQQQAELANMSMECACLSSKYQQLEHESQQDCHQLKQQLQLLQQQLWEMTEQQALQQRAADEAAAAAAEDAHRKLRAAEDTNEDLMKRLDFVISQLTALK
jgi:septal ring factor EnvC (AmiA/AmiB activator)